MSIQRSNRCRLRVEALEGREVPAVVTPTDPTIITTPAAGTTTTVSDPAPGGTTTDTTTTDTTTTDPTDTTDPTVTTTGDNTQIDGTPQTQTIDLGLSAIVDKTKPSLGDIVTIRLTLVNNGDLPTSGANVTATLPAGLTVVTTGTNVGNFDATTGIWSAGVVFPGEPKLLVIKAKVTDSTEQLVSASITGADQTDPTPENNSASVTLTPILSALSVKQSVSQSTVVINGTVFVTTTVKNTGPGTARNIAIQETLPSGMTWVRVQSPTIGAYQGKTRTWSISALRAGATASFTFVVQIHKAGALPISATMTATGIDETLSNLAGQATVTGTKVNHPSTWTYTGPGFTPPVVKPAVPAPVLSIWTPSLIAQLMAYFSMLKKK